MLESVGVGLNCLVLVVLGCLVSQGPTRENLQTADSQANRQAVMFVFAACFLTKVVWGYIFPQNVHT